MEGPISLATGAAVHNRVAVAVVEACANRGT